MFKILAEKTKLRPELLRFFRKNPNPTDQQMHDLAADLGVDPHELETEVYRLLTWFMSGRWLKHAQLPDEDFDPEQLTLGIEVESEHTDRPEIAKAIAKAHLKEIPDYYTWLQGMEAKAKG